MVVSISSRSSSEAEDCRRGGVATATAAPRGLGPGRGSEPLRGLWLVRRGLDGRAAPWPGAGEVVVVVVLVVVVEVAGVTGATPVPPSNPVT